MPVRAIRLIRKMRGGAQAHLMEAEDGSFYVVKFSNNPQHRRVLVNEWLAARILRYLRIASPAVEIVECTADFLESNPEVHIHLGSRRIPVEAGWHFGSRFPGDPTRLAVYDFIPDVLLPQVANIRDFAGALVFDRWCGNADSRQSIFFRARVRVRETAIPDQVTPGRQAFVTQMIDHGYIFEGPNWRFSDSPVQGLYHRPAVYAFISGWDDFQPWLDWVVHFPEEVLDEAYASLPPSWLADEGSLLENLLETLLRRRKRVPDLIEDCRGGRMDPFPNWRRQ